jgi:hypothetical protein
MIDKGTTVTEITYSTTGQDWITGESEDICSRSFIFGWGPQDKNVRYLSTLQEFYVNNVCKSTVCSKVNHEKKRNSSNLRVLSDCVTVDSTAKELL